MSRSSLRPSIGFLLLVSSYSLLVATLAWGFSVPELERVWVIMQGMQRSQFRGLHAEEERTLKLALSHYPTLARAFIGRSPIGFAEPTQEGWASLAQLHMIRGPLSQANISLDMECEAPASDYPVTVLIDRAEGRQNLRFTESGHQKVEIGLGTPSTPELIPVTVVSATGAIQSTKIRINAKGLPSKVLP